MDGFKVRQGTIYEDTTTKHQILLINHNIMNLQSLLLEGENSTFDIYNTRKITVDEIIEIRHNPNYIEKGDLTPEAFIELLKALLNTNTLHKDDIPYIKELYKSYSQD